MANAKELKELLALGFEVIRIVKSELQDGFQASDLLSALEKLTTEESVAKIQLALEGAAQIPVEAGQIDLFSGLDLARYVLAEIKTLG